MSTPSCGYTRLGMDMISMPWLGFVLYDPDFVQKEWNHAHVQTRSISPKATKPACTTAGQVMTRGGP